VADFVFNFSGMANDVHTIFSSKTSTWQKIGAAADLGFNLWMDVNMFDGEGEALRAVDLAARGAEDLASHGAEDVGTHVLEDAVGCGTGLSFRATTLVTVAHGSQAIGTIRPGEKVLAYNPKTHRMELEPVVRVWINHDSDLVDLTVTTSTHAPHSTVVQKHSEVLHTNQRHPFLTLEKGFVPVSQLTLGMHVLNADGTVGTVTGWKVVPGTQVMYNLDVAQDHTYTVGAGEWVVHNCSPGDVGSYKDMLAAGTPGDGLTPHHMPQASLADHFGYTRATGGTVVMDQATHELTFNYGGRANGVKRFVIENGLSFRDALAQSIRDYRSLVPDSNGSMRQLLQYWRDTYPALMKK